MTRDLSQDISRGRQATRELQETAAAFDAVKAAIVKAISETPVGADAKVLKLHMSLQNLAAVREALMKTISAGNHAEYVRAAEDAIARIRRDCRPRWSS